TAAAAPASDNPAVDAALWLGGAVLLGCLLLGTGGAFFFAWLAPTARRSWGTRAILALTAVGLVADPITVGVQGVDTLGSELTGLATGAAWAAGSGTSYGATALLAEVALALALSGLIVT